ncbi:MAG: multiheme c-type cytochrome [Planctomycetota bacterium]
MLIALLALGACGQAPDDAAARSDTPAATHAAAPEPVALAFVGSKSCRECHAEAYEAWVGSHHEQAMQVASPELVLGNFDDASHDHYGDATGFRGGAAAPQLDATSETGETTAYPVTHTFGVEPLQQYLAAFPNGHYQVTTVAWDTRPEADGGQRWFHIYPDEPVGPDHPFHWTGELQNWNSQCAECHSTGLEKNHAFQDDSYSTTWTEISVACEACHGRGSQHVDWARDPEALASVYGDAGLELRLGADRAWIPNPETGIARREPVLPAQVQPEACGRCHARRGGTTDDYRFGEPLLETHRPAFIEAGLYHPDGQILDEVYVYGSFLQSKMYDAGVTCTDCHDPHTARLKVEGDAVCAQCHLPTKFAAAEHTKHPEASVACVDCHMAEELYMVVDGRRDHSFRVPRPDLSLTTGSPNACTGCHEGQDDSWAAETVATWYPDGRQTEPHYGLAFAAAWSGDPVGPAALGAVAADPAQTDFVRASALFGLRGMRYGTDVFQIVEVSLRDDSALVRYGALQALETVPPNPAVNMALPLLADDVRGVRIAAARIVAPVDGQLPPTEQRRFDRAAAELMAAERFNFDREAGHLNFANFMLARGQGDRADAAYRRGLERYPESVALKVNLADALRALDRDPEALVLLEEARGDHPEAGAVRESLALAYIRAERPREAVTELRRLVELQPESARSWVLLVLGLEQIGEIDEASGLLQEIRGRFPADPMVLSVRLGAG